jgi:ABC-type hemin transport system substrate-binding protein
VTESITDATGAALDRRPATRVVSLVPSLTEAAWTLGRGSVLVGVTPHCVTPEAARRSAAVVGGPMGVDAEAVLGLAPDLVLSCKEENSKAEVEALRAAGARVYVTSPKAVAHVPPLLRDLGVLLDASERAEVIARAVEAAAEAAEARAAGERAVPVTCPVWLDPPRALGRGTYAADLIRLAGGAVEPDLEGYPPLEPGVAAPEVILLPDEPHPFSRADVPALGLSESPAARSGRVHEVDGRTLFWYGPRAAAAVAALYKLVRRSS